MTEAEPPDGELNLGPISVKGFPIRWLSQPSFMLGLMIVVHTGFFIYYATISAPQQNKITREWIDEICERDRQKDIEVARENKLALSQVAEAIKSDRELERKDRREMLELIRSTQEQAKATPKN